jgi:hypothetical protein
VIQRFGERGSSAFSKSLSRAVDVGTGVTGCLCEGARIEAGFAVSSEPDDCDNTVRFSHFNHATLFDAGASPKHRISRQDYSVGFDIAMTVVATEGMGSSTATDDATMIGIRR